jgi:signal peptidase II
MMTQISSKSSRGLFWKRWFLLLHLSFWSIGLDQWSKWFIQKMVPEGSVITVTPFLDWVHIWNKGISFGFFPCETLWGRSLLTLLILVFVGILLRMYAHSVTSLQKWGFSFMVAGALSNGIDRIVHAGVFDFIRVHWGAWDFPAFNVADMLISMGFLALLSEQFQWNALRFQKKPR